MRLSLLLMIGMATPALAEQACPASAIWDKPVHHLAARAPEMKFALKADTATDLTLVPAEQVKVALRLSRAAKPGRWAGLAAIDVSKAGKLDVALSTATYVDLIRDGKALKSVSFGQPKNCPNVHKSVTFDVVPGRYILQFTDAPDKAVRMAAVLR